MRVMKRLVMGSHVTKCVMTGRVLTDRVKGRYTTIRCRVKGRHALRGNKWY